MLLCFWFSPLSDIGREKDTYTDDSEHGHYDSRTDQSLLIQNTPTRQKPEPRTKSSLKVMNYLVVLLKCIGAPTVLMAYIGLELGTRLIDKPQCRLPSTGFLLMGNSFRFDPLTLQSRP